MMSILSLFGSSDSSSASSSSSSFSFQKIHPLDKRQQEAHRMLIKYPNRIPVIIESVVGAPPLERTKYLVPQDLTFGQLKYVIRKRVKLQPEHAMFLFINGSILPPDSEMVGRMYTTHQNVDKFLYIHFALENTFG